MNLRKAENYRIGLDIGTASVGWAVVDENGEPYSFKGKTTWGSRLFTEGKQAAEARGHRSVRRRLRRRRQRLDLLQGMFAAEMSKVDPDFFIRMRQSSLWPDDRDKQFEAGYEHPFFNSDDFTEVEYYKQFPTIYHLRSHLVNSSEKADIRLVYLALHHIIKYRGNFLRQGEIIHARDANTASVVSAFAELFEDFCDQNNIKASPSLKELQEALEEKGIRNDSRKEQIIAALNIADNKNMSKHLANAFIGHVADFSFILPVEKSSDSKFAVSNDEKSEAFYDVCPDDYVPLYESILAVYKAYVLSDILSVGEIRTISDSKVNAYNQHKNDLVLLKELIRGYRPERYKEFFSGTKDNKGNYVPAKAKGYTAYILGHSKMTHESFLASIRELFRDIPEATADSRYKDIESRLDKEDGDFLQKLRIRDNGAIPYQLHLEELASVIANQGTHYPFLLEEYNGISKIQSLLEFRIPYYVGPLNAHPNPDGARQFAWMERKDGKQGIPIRPWNYKEIIDKDKTATEFIERMTGTCTYVYGEKTLPRHSLLYEEFTVLNELNGVRWNKDGENFHRFDQSFRAEIIEELFKRQKSVTTNKLSKWLRKKGFPNNTVKGTQGETGFESKLTAYNDFCKIFDVKSLDECGIPMIEDLIRWITLFEDKNILRYKIQKEYGDQLSQEQIESIVKLNYSGWGRLSRKLLCDLKVETNDGDQSIMDILRFGNPNADFVGSAMILQEILTDSQLGFGHKIDEVNERSDSDGRIELVDLPGSSAIKRAINQASKIVDEIIGIAGKPPSRICIEVTRSDELSLRGRRTTTRLKKLKEVVSCLIKEDPVFYSELRTHLRKNEKNVANERVMLYFLQGGKCLYSRKPLDIARLWDYEVDHILPRVYTKDDSFENKALVLRSANQRKGSNLLLEDTVISAQASWWQSLKRAGALSDRKFNNLVRREISDRVAERFINRQLVETSQAIKLAKKIIQAKYPDVTIVPVKAQLSSDLRDKSGLIKCRDINDYHHAHDAYLACQIDIFLQARYPNWSDGRYVGMMRRYIAQLGKECRGSGRNLLGHSSFIVDSFGRDGFDRETGEIFQDTWDAEGHLMKMRKHLGRKDCYISRRTTIESGAFWDETIYSPNDARVNAAIPLKDGLCPSRYGGYSRGQFAYYVAFSATDSKGGTKFFLEGVPRDVASRVAGCDKELERWVDSVALSKKCKDVKILRRRVNKFQKFILGGDELYVTGVREARIFTQPAYSSNVSAMLQSVIDVNENKSLTELTCDDLLMVYDALTSTLDKNCSRLSNSLRLDERRKAFIGANCEEKHKVLGEINSSISGKRNTIDIRYIGGSRYSGSMQLTYGNLLPDIDFVDTSVTGMFERSWSVGI